MTTNRRQLIGAAALAAAAGGGSSAQAAKVAAREDAGWLQTVLERYAGFGDKASGGAGDEASGAWLEGELSRIGYTCERQRFEVPFFEPSAVSLVSGAARAQVVPQALVNTTPIEGLTAPLRRVDTGSDLTGAIALVSLPYKRWAALGDAQAARPLADAFRRGAMAAVAITNGPSGEAVALNVPADRPAFERPIVILAPKDAQPFLTAATAGAAATLTVSGRAGRRPAYNVIGRLDRGAEKTLVLSTPRSGWFGCVAERGSGLAVWLGLAHWLVRQRHRVNLELLATSGHEYLYLGGERYLKERAPAPAKTRLWCHIGASLAAREWHEIGAELRPLPSADAQRVMTATGDVIEPVRQAFRGLSGLEAVYPATRANAGGELVNVIEAGYPSAIGEYGGHRYFHTRGDDLRCVSGELVSPVLDAYRKALDACLR